MAVPSSVLTLLASGAYSSSMSGLGSAVSVSYPAAAAFQLDVTVAPSTSAFATATLDVQLLHSLDGTNFDSFLRFAQVTGGSTAVARSIASWNGMIAASSSMNMHAGSTTTLAAGQVLNGAIGGTWKVGYTIANGAAAASSSAYTFSVKANVFHQS